ncbi:MAG TPA: hypothetical protein VHU23_00250 [Rhizomicrobium sp.]|jgi:hypothetical protein|nr:hypothetical protein [Rhizomicrobium sp.]
MIFSRQHDFLFIKGRKVAGTSVEIALSSICGPDDIITPITPIDEMERLKRGGKGAQNYSDSRDEERRYLRKLGRKGPEELKKGISGRELYSSHMALREFVLVFGSLPTSRVFCVERSPYAKVISRAVMALEFDRYKKTGGEMAPDIERIRTAVSDLMAKPNRISVCKNIELYRAPAGDLPIRVLRHEALPTDFAALLTEYGISTVPELPHAKKGVESNRLDPRALFTRAQLDLINEAYADEFEVFGYERI